MYERDAYPDFRVQGGSVDLHKEGGQRAMRVAGLWDEYTKHWRPEGEVLKLIKYDSSLPYDEDITGNGRRPADFGDPPEVDRIILRSILLDSLKPGTIA